MPRMPAAFALVAIAALPVLSAGGPSSAVEDAIDDLLGPDAAQAADGYGAVLKRGTAAERLELALSLRAEGGQTNLVRAARLLCRAAQSGDSDAKYWLARMYETGEGMKRPFPEKAVRLARQGTAATGGFCHGVAQGVGGLRAARRQLVLGGVESARDKRRELGARAMAVEVAQFGKGHGVP